MVTSLWFERSGTRVQAKHWYHLWSAAIIVLVGVAVLSLTDLAGIHGLLVQINVSWALAGVGLYLTGHLLRTVRLGYMLEEAAIPFSRLFTWSGLHAVWNYLLPARTGELSLVVYLKYHENQPASKTTALLIAVRSLETVLTLLLVALVLVPFGDVIRPNWGIPVQAGVFLLLAIIVFLIWRLRAEGPSPSESGPGDAPASFWQRILKLFAEVLTHLRSLLRRPKWVRIIGLTLIIWCLNLTMYYTLFPALGTRIPILIVLMIVTGMAFAQATPIQSFLSIGSHEIVWVPMLQIAGLPLSDSVSLAVGTHLLILAYVFGFAILLAGLRARVRPAVVTRVGV